MKGYKAIRRIPCVQILSKLEVHDANIYSAITS